MRALIVRCHIVLSFSELTDGDRLLESALLDGLLAACYSELAFRVCGALLRQLREGKEKRQPIPRT